MKNYMYMFFSLAVAICIWFVPTMEVARASTQININEVKLSGIDSSSIRTAVSNTPIDLIGPKEDITLYYRIQTNTSGKNNKLVLNITHSELLISPSSITISVDGEKILSKRLNKKTANSQLVIPLPNKALKKGEHRVTLSFYGVIKEGVCVEQGTSGNWLSIGIDSYFQLKGQLNGNKQLLMDYPKAFTGTSKNPVSIVLPDDASPATLNSGLMVATYLAGQSNYDNSIKIVRESKVSSIHGNVVFIGATTEFSTPFMKKILKKAELPNEESAMIISRHKLVNSEKKADRKKKHNSKKQVEAFIVTASSPKELEKRISILTNDNLTSQLSGNQMTIKEIPNLKETSNKSIVPFKNFGIENLTLDSKKGKSQHYYFYVPVSIQSNTPPTLQLHVKRSEIIASLKEEYQTDSLSREDVELVVLVNDVPHSVNIQTLSDETNGVFVVNVPIDKTAVKENGMMDIQFISNGLSNNNTCLGTDVTPWIFIKDTSHFVFQKGTNNKKAESSLAAFPTQFASEDMKTAVILPEDGIVLDKQLQQLYRSLSINGHTPNLNLIKGNEVTKEDLMKQNVIFIGGPSIHPLLNEVKNDLLVTYELDKPNLNKFGFVTESVGNFAWVQSNPWSQTQHSILVFDSFMNKNNYFDESFLRKLKDLDDVATIAVKSNNHQLFTNAEQLENEIEKTADKVEKNNVSSFSIWWVVVFVALISIAVLLIVIVKRGKRKKTKS